MGTWPRIRGKISIAFAGSEESYRWSRPTMTAWKISTRPFRGWKFCRWLAANRKWSAICDSSCEQTMALENREISNLRPMLHLRGSSKWTQGMYSNCRVQLDDVRGTLTRMNLTSNITHSQFGHWLRIQKKCVDLKIFRLGYHRVCLLYLELKANYSSLWFVLGISNTRSNSRKTKLKEASET